MFGAHDLPLFIVSGLLLNIIPGPDSLYIIGRSASQGWRAGSAAAFGVGAGTIVHILTAALGLSAILATSATAFTLVKFIGAIYLLYMGISMLRSTPVEESTASLSHNPPNLGRVFTQGFFTNALNPKVALFFLAFVPQFIEPATPNKALAFVFLGAIFSVNGLIWCNFLAWSTATASRRFKQSKETSAWLNRIAGSVFIYFGVRLAVSDQAGI